MSTRNDRGSRELLVKSDSRGRGTGTVLPRRRVIGRLLASFAAGTLALSGLAVPGVAVADPAPRFTVSPTDPPDQIWGEEWAPSSAVVLEVDDPNNGEGVDFSTTAGTDAMGSFGLQVPFDIRAGHVVTVSEGATVKSHVVIDLRVSMMDLLTDTVSGIGAPNTDTVVTVWDGQLQVAQRVVMAGDIGAWTATFSPDFDIALGMWSTSSQADVDGDTTMIVGQPPSFIVFLGWDGSLTGSGWPAEVNVEVTADDPGTVTSSDIELTIATDAEGFFEGAGVFPGLQPGWLVTVTDGQVAMTHTVRSISITDVDTGTDLVRGTADPGTEVWVAVSGGPGVFVTADSSGEWVAGFSGVHDITVGSEVGVQATDDNGNSTDSGYTVQLPPIAIPPGASLTTTSHGTASSGTPTVFWRDPLSLSTTGRSGGTGTATLTMSDGYVQTIALVEVPPSSGTYIGTFDAPYPIGANVEDAHHGPASISFTIHYPDVPDQQGEFTLYIDPSGVVRDTFGNSVVGATVTLSRSVNLDGPFVAVSNGSSIMSPGNRTNPDLTGTGGLFGWDVVPGYYKVRAEKAGCTAPDGGGFVETNVMRIPPPVTDLELVLHCTAAATTLTYTGDTRAIAPARTILKATLADSEAACNVVDKTINFYVDLTGDGDFNDTGESIGTAQTVAGTNNSAKATLSPSLALQPGVYLVKVTFAGTSECAPSERANGVVSVVTRGDSARGDGEYRIAGVTGTTKNVYFEFTTSWDKRANGYTGQILIEENQAWRLKGEITSFAKISSRPPTGTATGTARLYRWNVGLHRYALVDQSVSFKVTFMDERSTKKSNSNKPFSFTVNWIVDYSDGVVSPLVTGSSLQPLTRGSISIR